MAEPISARLSDGAATNEDRQLDLTLRPTRIEDYVDMAFTAAAGGRPGPAVLLCPRDLFQEEASNAPPEVRRRNLGSYPLDRFVADPARVRDDEIAQFDYLAFKDNVAIGLAVAVGARSPSFFRARSLRNHHARRPEQPVPQPLVEPALTFGCRERLDADGRVLVPLEDAEVRDVVERVRASGATAVAVCGLHAYRNPANERELAV